MPKPMMLMLRVEEIAFGRVFRLCKNMPGVISLDIDGNADTPTPTPNAGRSQRGNVKDGSTRKCVILSALEKTPGLMISQMMDPLRSAGKGTASVSALLNQMIKDGLIRKKSKKVKGEHSSKAVYFITPQGQKYMTTNCNLNV